MSALRQALEQYLSTRQAVGFKLRGYHSRLSDFVTHLEQAGATTITSELALAWATKPQNVHPYTWTVRLSMVGGFARYLNTLDPACEMPSANLLGHRRRPRPEPYLYSDPEVTALLEASSRLSPQLRAACPVTSRESPQNMQPARTRWADRRGDLEAPGGRPWPRLGRWRTGWSLLKVCRSRNGIGITPPHARTREARHTGDHRTGLIRPPGLRSIRSCEVWVIPTPLESRIRKRARRPRSWSFQTEGSRDEAMHSAWRRTASPSAGGSCAMTVPTCSGWRAAKIESAHGRVAAAEEQRRRPGGQPPGLRTRP